MKKRKQAVLPPLTDAGYHRDIFLMMIPLLLMAVYLYGWRPALLSAAAVVTANICDRIVARLRGRHYDARDMSSEAFAFVLVMLMPASVDYYVVVSAALFTVMVGKEAFGGYGSYPFHPTAVGFVMAAISWPEQVFRYPQPFSRLPLGSCADVTLVSSIPHTMKSGGLPTVSTLDMWLGDYAGPMGATAALIVVSCAVLLLVQKRISWRVPVLFLVSSAAVAFLFPRLGGVPMAWPWEFAAERIAATKYELLSGGTLFAAVFLFSEPVTMPKNKHSQTVYAVLLGFMSMMFRYFGSYETGACFALLVVNSVSGWLDRAVLRSEAKKARRLEAKKEVPGNES